jgi:hypothetical protein
MSDYSSWGVNQKPVTREELLAGDRITHEQVDDGLVSIEELRALPEWSQDAWGNWLRVGSPSHMEMLNRNVETALGTLRGLENVRREVSLLYDKARVELRRAIEIRNAARAGAGKTANTGMKKP